MSTACDSECCGKKENAIEDKYPSVDQIANYRSTNDNKSSLPNGDHEDALKMNDEIQT